MSRVEKIRTAVTKLRDLEDSQMETTLLRFCLSLPKFNFILRSYPPSHIRNAASVFDGLMRESLSDLVGAPLSDWAWLKASLPSSLGGLNMRSATLHAPSTYVSSLDQSQLLMKEILDRHPAPSRPVVLNLGSIEPQGSVSQFQGFGGLVHPTRMIRDVTLCLAIIGCS